MTTQTLRNGATLTINLQTGETLKVVAVSGNYTLTGKAGSVAGTAIATAATGGTYGPYSAPVTVLLASSVSSEIDFDSGATPVVTSDTVAYLNTDPVAGGATGFSVNGITQALSQPITTPSGFRGTTLAAEMDMRRTLGGIVTNFDITSKIPAVTKAYYVDPINGNNANSGLTAPLAKKDLSVVLAIADCDQIIITGLTADFVGIDVQSWKNIKPTRSMSVINNTGYRYISTACTGLPTWAVNGTYGNVYSTVISSVNGSGVTDLRTSSVPSYVDAGGNTVNLSNVPKRYRTLVKVANLAAVAATPGTWFHDGTSLHVRAHDDRNLVGDTKMIPSNQTQNGRFPTGANNITLYVQGIDFVGGNSAFYVYDLSTVTGGVFAYNNCSFQGAAVANAMSIGFLGKVYGYRSAFYDAYIDGANYHSNESDGTTTGTSPDWCEIECVSAGCGMTGNTSNSSNATTSHDFCNGIRLNCVYLNSYDRPLADTNSAHAWNLGGAVGQSALVASGRSSISALATTKLWLDSVYAIPGSNARWLAAQTAQLKHFNSGAVVNDVTGEATGTVAAYYG